MRKRNREEDSAQPNNNSPLLRQLLPRRRMVIESDASDADTEIESPRNPTRFDPYASLPAAQPILSLTSTTEDDEELILIPPPRLRPSETQPFNDEDDDVLLLGQPPAPPTPDPVLPLVLPDFTTADAAPLWLNRFNRYKANSNAVAWAVYGISLNTPGQVSQYAPPPYKATPPEFEADNATVYSSVVPLEPSSIYLHHVPNGGLALRAKTEEGRVMRSRRAYFIKVTETDQTSDEFMVHPTSPVKYGESLSYDMPVKKFKDGVTLAMRRESGHVVLKKPDILERDTHTVRQPCDQNTTMGKPAVEEAEKFYNEHKEMMTDEFIEIVMRSFKATLPTQYRKFKRDLEKLEVENLAEKSPDEREKITTQKATLKDKIDRIKDSMQRYEYLHGNSYRHTPISENPQHKENLGAAMAWLNTKMMILEGVAKWFELNVVGVHVETFFEWDKMFDSQMLSSLDFKVVIKYKNFTVELTQDINCYVSNPEFVKASDIVGLASIICAKIQKKEPQFAQYVNVLAKPPQYLVDQQTTARPEAPAALSASTTNRPAFPDRPRPTVTLFRPPTEPSPPPPPSNVALVVPSPVPVPQRPTNYPRRTLFQPPPKPTTEDDQSVHHSSNSPQ